MRFKKEIQLKKKEVGVKSFVIGTLSSKPYGLYQKIMYNLFIYRLFYKNFQVPNGGIE